MYPLILSFAEECIQSEDSKNLPIEYDEKQSLSVMAGTKIPAFDVFQLRTLTGTKAGGEPSDSDRSDHHNDQMNIVLATKTKTFSGGEGSDDDK